MKFKGTEKDLLILSERFINYIRGDIRTTETTQYWFSVDYNEESDYYWFDTDNDSNLELWLTEQPEYTSLEEIV